jgi:hypothetical protein
LRLGLIELVEDKEPLVTRRLFDPTLLSDAKAAVNVLTKGGGIVERLALRAQAF